MLPYPGRNEMAKTRPSRCQIFHKQDDIEDQLIIIPNYFEPQLLRSIYHNRGASLDQFITAIHFSMLCVRWGKGSRRPSFTRPIPTVDEGACTGGACTRKNDRDGMLCKINPTFYHGSKREKNARTKHTRERGRRERGEEERETCRKQLI